MSGRLVLSASEQQLVAVFGSNGHLYGLHPMPPRYNIAPTQPVLTIIQERDRRMGRLMRWGFIPEWVKDPNAFSLINSARCETVEEKPSFRNAIRRRRCLIPVSGFYEWQKQQVNTTGEKDEKQPYYVAMTDGQLFALAAIWETWMGPYGEEVDTTAILTKRAGGSLNKLGDRMPVVIGPGDFDLWLDHSSDYMHDARPLLRGALADQLVSHPVSSRVNKVSNDDISLIEPLVRDTEPSNELSADTNAESKSSYDATEATAQLKLF